MFRLCKLCKARRMHEDGGFCEECMKAYNCTAEGCEDTRLKLYPNSIVHVNKLICDRTKHPDVKLNDGPHLQDKLLNCVLCGNEYEGHPASLYCIICSHLNALDLDRIAENEQYNYNEKVEVKIRPKNCVFCGNELKTRNMRKVYCDRKCRDSARKSKQLKQSQKN